MSVTTFQGTVENGQVRLPANVSLPEKTKFMLLFLTLNKTRAAGVFNLAEMISRMPPDYQVSEERFGEPVGKEEW